MVRALGTEDGRKLINIIRGYSVIRFSICCKRKYIVVVVKLS
jgi:hypothetical protein